MEELIRNWTGENLIVRYDKVTGAWTFLAIHRAREGRAGGGTRIKSYPSPTAALEDALRLSEAMTSKMAVSNMPYGGAKAVISIPSGMDAAGRHGLLRRHGELVKQLGGLFTTGPDVGTSPEDIDLMAETGSPYIFGRSTTAGGPGGSGPATALGVLTGMQVTCLHLYGDSSLQGRKVLVQGAGSVGGALMSMLRKAGAEVSFSELDEATIIQYRDVERYPYVSPDAIFGMACDIFSPCALGRVLNQQTISQLKCRAIVGAANNQLAEPADAERLRVRHILYAPDYVANAGGVIYLIGMEALGWSRRKAEREVVERIRPTLAHVFALAEQDGITTEAAAERIVQERLDRP